MMKHKATLNDVHQQFAEYFDIPALKPYAYLLSKKLSEGHICLHLNKVNEEALPYYYEIPENGANALQNIPLIGNAVNDNQPFILHQNRLYLQRYFRYETNFLQQIQRFLLIEKSTLAERTALLKNYQVLISKLLTSTTVANDGDDPADWQVAAIITGVLNNFTVITGGPGTGKTTTVAKILAILYTIDPSLKVALAAPTGKAAARMAESLRNAANTLDAAMTTKFLNLQPATIHRLLKPISGSPYFKHNKDNPLLFDVVIVDECSMIDVALFAKLMDAVNPHARLILLGDKDQLASVEAGSLFGDLCQAQEKLNLFTPERRQLINAFIANKHHHISASHECNDCHHSLFQHLIELRRSHRFSGHTGIGKFSRAIIVNNVAVMSEFFEPPANEQVIIDTTAAAQLFESFIAGYAFFIKEKNVATALKQLNACRVLTAVREGPHGLNMINKRIEKYLSDKKLIAANTTFYENRPIMLTRNYYEYELFNGDTGIIRKDEKGVLMAWFEDSRGGVKAILPNYLIQAETAFAMTIHKSQGSEFNEVWVVLPDIAEMPILTRELLYTAVSRAKQKVYIQGTPAVIYSTAERFVKRASGIAARFKAEEMVINYK